MNKLAYRLIAYVAIALAVGAGVFFGAKILANWGISSIVDTPAAQEQRLARVRTGRRSTTGCPASGM